MHPILFELPGGAPVRSYGALVAAALLLGWITSLSNAKRRGLEVEKLGVAYVLAAVCALVGARVVWVLQNTGAYEGPLSLLRLQAGQLALGGGLVAGALATWIYCRQQGLRVLQWLDAAAGPLLLGMALERLGAFLAGTDFGLYAPGNPLAVHFPNGSPAHLLHLRTMTGTVLPTGQSLPVHPTQLYALAIMLVGLALVRRLGKGPGFEGRLAVVAFAAYVAARMVVEPFFLAQRDAAQVGGMDLDIAGGVFYLLVLALAYRSLGRRAQSPAAGQAEP